MNQSKVVLFMKGNRDVPRCGFSKTMVALLKEQNVVDYTTFDILTDDSVRQGEYPLACVAPSTNDEMIWFHPKGLKKLNDWPTFPQLIIDGEFVGGLDVIKEAVANGEFAELIAQ
jgi:glutaredoxin-related protein